MNEVEEVLGSALPLEVEADLDPLLERVGDARCVLLGEASHGTHEYYAWRAALTRRLVAEKGFSFVAVEGDWPDCWQVSRSVTLAGDAPRDPAEVLDGYRRWPTWMWANRETVDFCRWLRDHNAATGDRVGFYGLDVYSLWDSLRSVIGYLSERRPEYVETALAAYRCFEPHGEDPGSYALVPGGCEDEVLELLTRLRRPAEGAEDLNARQNAEVAAGAERYYRAMIGGGPESWNVRDVHMADTLDRLLDFHGPGARGVVWAHNTHVGDARATDMAAAGMVNLGQLARDRHGRDAVVAVGFAGGSGEVIAAPRWGGTMEAMAVPAPGPGSVEALLTETGLARALFVFSDGPGAAWPRERRGHRAIGVVYDPGRDPRNYVPTVLAERYDALCWFRRTSALAPLHLEAARRGELETLPSGV
ncbi:erythromycin esterase family protein [Actinomadura kijaniata]|uniref:erythromycin esterase family protein n=1 Tax=Actinomadura kijaniata TaxID=46161 RepID=UPI003F1D22A8